MPIDECLNKFGFLEIYIYIYDVFSSIYIIVWESIIFVHSSRVIHERQTSMDE